MSSIVTPTNLTFQWGLYLFSLTEHQNVGIVTFALFSCLHPVYCMSAWLCFCVALIAMIVRIGSSEWLIVRESRHTRVEMGRRDCLVRSNTFSTFYIPSKVTREYSRISNISLFPSYRPWVSMRQSRCGEHQPRYQAERGFLTIWVVHVLRLYLSGSLYQNTSGQGRTILRGRSYQMMPGQNTIDCSGYFPRQLTYLYLPRQLTC